jgi:hypothetical protein
MKSFAAIAFLASAEALRIRDTTTGTAGTAGTADLAVQCPTGEKLSADGTHCVIDQALTAPCPSGTHDINGTCTDVAPVPTAGTYRVDEVEEAIQAAFWGWCDELALQTMSQGWWEDWQLLESIGDSFMDVFGDEWGWASADKKDCAAFLTSMSPDSLVDKAIENMTALATRKEQPGYWDSWNDGYMHASYWNNKYNDDVRKWAFEDGVDQGVFDAKSAMFGAMARPNWNETYDASWNGTNGTNSTNTTGYYDCPTGTTC